MAAEIRLFFREAHIDTNAPIVSGAVKITGFETRIVDRLDEADAWDCPFGGRVLDFGREPRLVSIPAFPNRKFRLSYIFVNRAAGIEKPTDLHGKRVAVRFWSNTAAIWARGALAHHYGVDLTKIRWASAIRDDSPIPTAFNVSYLDEGGRAPGTAELDAMLVAGELDAVIDANLPPSLVKRDGRTRRLFPNFASEERDYFESSGIFPISHVMTLRSAFVDRHPHAPAALLAAFRAARRQAFADLEGSDPRVIVLPWAAQHLEDQRRLMGQHYFAYDIEHNRIVLDAMMRFAHEQGVTERLLNAEDLFDPTVIGDVDPM